MYAPWAIPNDPRIALANMNAVFPKTNAVQNKTLIAENVEVDMETLRTATSANPKVYAITIARCRIVNAVLNALAPKDRKLFEAYSNGESEV